MEEVLTATHSASKRKLLKMAIVKGIAIDLIVTFLFVVLVTLLYTAVISNGTFIAFGNIEEEVTINPLFFFLFFIEGTFASVLGGYVAAYSAKVRPYAHALWAAGISVFFASAFGMLGLVTVVNKTVELNISSIFWLLFGLFLTPVAYASGAYVASLVLAETKKQIVTTSDT